MTGPAVVLSHRHAARVCAPHDSTATLIEIAKDSDAWEELATKVIGSPVNVKFNEFFTTFFTEASIDSMLIKVWRHLVWSS